MGTDDNGYDLAVWQSGKTPYRHLFSTDSSPDSSPVFGIVETGRVSWSAWRRRGRTPNPTTLRRTASRARCGAPPARPIGAGQNPLRSPLVRETAGACNPTRRRSRRLSGARPRWPLGRSDRGGERALRGLPTLPAPAKLRRRAGIGCGCRIETCSSGPRAALRADTPSARQLAALGGNAGPRRLGPRASPTGDRVALQTARPPKAPQRRGKMQIPLDLVRNF
jgi:hypothetical protein